MPPDNRCQDCGRYVLLAGERRECGDCHGTFCWEHCKPCSLCATPYCDTHSRHAPLARQFSSPKLLEIRICLDCMTRLIG